MFREHLHGTYHTPQFLQFRELAGNSREFFFRSAASRMPSHLAGEMRDELDVYLVQHGLAHLTPEQQSTFETATQSYASGNVKLGVVRLPARPGAPNDAIYLLVNGSHEARQKFAEGLETG